MKDDIYLIYGDFLSRKDVDVGRRFLDLSMPTITDRIEYFVRDARERESYTSAA
jgi:hypothetical protein